MRFDFFFWRLAGFRSEARLSVPVSKLPELVYETKKEIEEAGLLATIVGHAGDGEFNPTRRCGIGLANVV